MSVRLVVHRMTCVCVCVLRQARFAADPWGEPGRPDKVLACIPCPPNSQIRVGIVGTRVEDCVCKPDFRRVPPQEDLPMERCRPPDPCAVGEFLQRPRFCSTRGGSICKCFDLCPGMAWTRLALGVVGPMFGVGGRHSEFRPKLHAPGSHVYCANLVGWGDVLRTYICVFRIMRWGRSKRIGSIPWLADIAEHRSWAPHSREDALLVLMQTACTCGMCLHVTGVTEGP